MHRDSEYRKYLAKKSTPTIVSRDIISLGLPKLGYVPIFSRSPQILVDDLKAFQPVKSSSSCNLGPGRYPTPPPLPGPSYTFGYSKRFISMDISPAQTERSTDKIKENKDIRQFSLLNKSESERDRFKIKHSKELITKRAKIIIENEKKAKIVTKIQEKLQRIDVRKHKNVRNSITKSMVTLMMFSIIPSLMLKRLSHLKNYQKKIQKFKVLLMYFSKAIGKFKLMKKKGIIESSWKKLRKFMLPVIREKKRNIHEMFYQRVLSLINRFLKSNSISRLNLLIRKKILLIQKSIRGFIMISRCRKQCVNLLWNKNDNNKKRIHPNAKGFYIWQYIHNNLVERISITSVDSNIKHFFKLPHYDNLVVHALNSKKETNSSVLRLYSKAKIKELIRNTYNLKKAGTINIPDNFIISDYLLHSEKEPKSIIKKKNPDKITINQKKIKFNVNSSEIRTKPKRKSLKIRRKSQYPLNP